MTCRYWVRKCCGWDLASRVKSEGDLLMIARIQVRKSDLVLFMIRWLCAVVGLAPRPRPAGGLCAHNAATFTKFSIKQSNVSEKYWLQSIFSEKKGEGSVFSVNPRKLQWHPSIFSENFSENLITNSLKILEPGSFHWRYWNPEVHWKWWKNVQTVKQGLEHPILS